MAAYGKRKHQKFTASTGRELVLLGVSSSAKIEAERPYDY